MDPMSIQIINSNSPWYRSHRHFDDALTDDGWIDWFLQSNGFPHDLPLCGDRQELLKELRALLLNALDALMDGKGLPLETLSGFNRYLSAAPMHYLVSVEDGKCGLCLKPEKCDWDAVLGEIAASFIKMVGERDASCFKRCGNPDCRWVFYDESRNRTRKWCCNACSSLIKVRRHRERKRNEPAEPG